MTVLLTFLLRWLLVVLFFPFSALDKILNFRGAVGQCRELIKPRGPAIAMICAGLAVEVFCSIGILTGIADRAAALILALYCMATAVLFKPFWAPGDFWAGGNSTGRLLFWDFLKNFSLAAGILLVTFGTGPVSIAGFLANPLASTHPYARHSAGVAP
jgi:putative oxidoreductase